MAFLKKRDPLEKPRWGFEAWLHPHAEGNGFDFYHVPLPVYWVLYAWRDIKTWYFMRKALRGRYKC